MLKEDNNPFFFFPPWRIYIHGGTHCQRLVRHHYSTGLVSEEEEEAGEEEEEEEEERGCHMAGRVKMEGYIMGD